MKSDSNAAQSVCGSTSNAEGPRRAKHREAFPSPDRYEYGQTFAPLHHQPSAACKHQLINLSPPPLCALIDKAARY